MGYGVIRVLTFKLSGQVSSEFSALLAAKLCVKPPKSFSVLEVLYHRAKYDRAQISPDAGAAQNVKFLYVYVCVCVCVFGAR